MRLANRSIVKKRSVELSKMAAAPGRVNIIGDHTDYNEGFVLPAAIDRCVLVAAAPRDDGTVHVLSLDYGEEDEFRRSTKS